MDQTSVKNFEDAVRAILGEMHKGTNADLTGIAIGPEHEDDLRRISATLLPLLQYLAQLKHLWKSDPNLIFPHEREASDKLYLKDNGDIVLPH